MLDATTLDLGRIAQDLQIRKVQVESVVQLLDEGNTVPFITRYRKERTGGLNEEAIRQIQGRVNFLRQLFDRKQTGGINPCHPGEIQHDISALLAQLFTLLFQHRRESLAIDSLPIHQRRHTATIFCVLVVLAPSVATALVPRP